MDGKIVQTAGRDRLAEVSSTGFLSRAVRTTGISIMPKAAAARF